MSIIAITTAEQIQRHRSYYKIQTAQRANQNPPTSCRPTCHYWVLLSDTIKSLSLLTFDAINIICVFLSHAFAAVFRHAVPVIIFLSIFPRPTLSEILNSNYAVTLLEGLLRTALNDVARFVPIPIIPNVFVPQFFFSSEAFYEHV